MIIGACGYGATGSSAVYDLIREFEGIQSLPFDSEFIYCYQVDGLQDLQYHLTETLFLCRHVLSFGRCRLRWEAYHHVP